MTTSAQLFMSSGACLGCYGFHFLNSFKDDLRSRHRKNIEKMKILGKHRVQKSDAGVGIGTLIGDRDYIARK